MDLSKLNPKTRSVKFFALRLSKKTGLSVADCMLLLKTFCNEISLELHQGNTIRLPALGLFKARILATRGFSYATNKVEDRVGFYLQWKYPQGLKLKMKYTVRAALGDPVLPKTPEMEAQMEAARLERVEKRRLKQEAAAKVAAEAVVSPKKEGEQ